MLQWLGLNPNLLCHIYPVNYDGMRIAGGEAIAPLVDGATLEGSFNWQSPFESMGAESKAPAITAMIQSGAILPVLNALSGTAVDVGGTMSGAADAAKDMRGMTGITRLNSTQIFSGMPPLKISATLAFRAFANANSEVMQPLNQLWKWALPQELAKDGAVANVVQVLKSNGAGAKDYLKALMPSLAPHLVGFSYKKRAFQLMVIESISEPLDSPITKNGDYARVLLPITLSTLSALDRNEWVKVSGSQTSL